MIEVPCYIHDQICDAINNWDPMGLIKYSKNEYDEIVNKFFNNLSNKITVEKIEVALMKSFKKHFGPICKKDIDYKNISQKLYDILNNEIQK